MKTQKIIYLSNSSQSTQEIAKKFVQETLPKLNFFKKAIVVELRGELGAGKTTFLKGFAAGLGLKDKILSPTFLIARRFPVKKFNFENFFHVDCYRINKPDEIKNIGLKEALKERKNIVAIEWPEKIKNLLSKESIKINIKINTKNKRKNRREIFIKFPLKPRNHKLKL